MTVLLIENFFNPKIDKTLKMTNDIMTNVQYHDKKLL
jgi:hypothetical protein